MSYTPEEVNIVTEITFDGFKSHLEAIGWRLQRVSPLSDNLGIYVLVNEKGERTAWELWAGADIRLECKSERLFGKDGSGCLSFYLRVMRKKKYRSQCRMSHFASPGKKPTTLSIYPPRDRNHAFVQFYNFSNDEED